jgi:hypothetical protein
LLGVAAVAADLTAVIRIIIYTAVVVKPAS